MRFRRRPFPRLVAHFASVIVNSGQDSGGTDLNLSIGGVLAMLAVPGASVSLMLFDKYSSLMQWMRQVREFDAYRASLPDKYFFIVLSMAISCVVTSLKWDRIFPRRQDYANLAALVLLAAMFALDVNAASAILFPMVVLAAKGSFAEFFAFVGVHALKRNSPPPFHRRSRGSRGTRGRPGESRANRTGEDGPLGPPWLRSDSL